jgi:hypothetical protein
MDFQEEKRMTQHDAFQALTDHYKELIIYFVFLFRTYYLFLDGPYREQHQLKR